MIAIPNEGPGDCAGPVWIDNSAVGDSTTKELLLTENFMDMGPREFAQGDVTLGSDGLPSGYTVAPGDLIESIGERFCIVNGASLLALNGYAPGETIHPGDVLGLTPDAWG